MSGTWKSARVPAATAVVAAMIPTALRYSTSWSGSLTSLPLAQSNHAPRVDGVKHAPSGSRRPVVAGAIKTPIKPGTVQGRPEGPAPAVDAALDAARAAS